MADTILNTTPANNSSDSSGMGFFLGIVVLVIAAGFFIYFGFPYVREMANRGVQITVPVTVPKDMNVTVEQPK